MLFVISRYVISRIIIFFSFFLNYTAAAATLIRRGRRASVDNTMSYCTQASVHNARSTKASSTKAIAIQGTQGSRAVIIPRSRSQNDVDEHCWTRRWHDVHWPAIRIRCWRRRAVQMQALYKAQMWIAKRIHSLIFVLSMLLRLPLIYCYYYYHYYCVYVKWSPHQLAADQLTNTQGLTRPRVWWVDA